VVIKGHSSSYVHVDSGVPQGTVLGPLMFLLYINDIIDNISSGIRLFADDCQTVYCTELSNPKKNIIIDTRPKLYYTLDKTMANESL